MDFSALIKKSLNIAWHNRVLWLFGFLSGGVGTGSYLYPGGINYQLPADTNSPITPGQQVLGAINQTASISQETWLLIGLVIFLVVFILLLVAIFVSNWASAALVFSTLNIEKERPTFQTGAKAGLKYWWNFYLVALVLGLFFLIYFLAFLVPIGFLFLVSWETLALIAFIIGAFVFILSLFIIVPVSSLLISLATRMIVHRGVGVLDSIQLSGGLIKKYKGDSLLTWLVSVGLNFAAGIAAIFIVLPIFFIVLVFLIFSFAIGFSFWLALIPIIPALILIFAACGFWQAFNATYWTLFYEHLASKEGW